MAGRELSIEEKTVVGDYQRVSRESKDEAKKLHLGFSAVYALLDSNLTTREEILLRIQHINGEPEDDSVEALSSLGHRLGETLQYLGSRSTSASELSADAARTAEQVELTGLPLS